MRENVPPSGDAATLAGEIALRISALPVRDTPSIRAVRREYSKLLHTSAPEFLLAVALELRRSAVHRFVGDELIAHHPRAAASLGAKEIELLGEGMNSWDQVDCFALYLAGPCWRRGQVSDGLVQAWAVSGDRWWRRAALVSTVALNAKAQGGGGDTPRTLTICRMLLRDGDDMIVKAMSWALRALSATDPTSVREFLAEQREILSRRVIREVENKLRTGLKNPRRA